MIYILYMTLLSILTGFYRQLDSKSYIPNPIMSLLRYVTRKVGNCILPIYLEKTSRRYSLDTKKRDRRIIVSFTSFPARIDYVWIIFECLVRQTMKPDEVILYISKEQFSSLDSLPSRLKNQIGRGLTIKLCDDDLRSHKKYHYAFKDYPDDFVVTVDDDIFYEPAMIENLMTTHKRFPKDVIANKTRRIKCDNEGNICNYNSWKYTTSSGGDNFNIQIGVGGVLYQPRLMYKDILNWDLAKKLCYNADDMWLFAMTKLSGHKVVRSNRTSNMNLGIRCYEQNIRLSSQNVGDNMNDIQINNIASYYTNTLGINPFKEPSKQA